MSMHSMHTTLKLAAAGIMATLAFEPIGLPIFLIPAFYILLEQVYKAPLKHAFYSGFIFGFFHFITSLYWIAIALTSNVGNFLWLIPFALLLIPILLGIYIGLACMASSLFRKNRLLFIIAFSLIWVITEIIRSYIPVQFPWNLMGYTLAVSHYTLAIAPIIGLHLSSLLVVFLACVLFSRDLKTTVIPYLLCILGFVIITEYRDQTNHFWDESVRIVQPNLAEHHIGKQESQNAALSALSEFSIAPSGSDDLKAIIWPEAAYPYLFHGTNTEASSLSALAPKGGYLITGADRMDNEKRLYNSIIAIGSDSKIASTYDKQILVPFGEYVPFSSLVPFVDKVAYGLYEFTPGSTYVTKLDNVAMKYYPLICYEVIFPINQDLTQYEWFLNITNDAWYGRSSGPYQHLAMAKFKAAEYGMPIIRVANTGISAVISPYGEVLEQIDLNTQDFMDTRIPKKLKPVSSLLRDTQNILIGLLFLVCLCINLALKPNQLMIHNIDENAADE